MIPSYALRVVAQLLGDIMCIELPSDGGFRQILPVVIHGGRT